MTKIIKEEQRQHRLFLKYNYSNLNLTHTEYISYIENELGIRALYKNKFVQSFLQEFYINVYELKTFKEAVYFIKNNLKEKPNCKNCSNNVKFRGEKYNNTCSIECSNSINNAEKVRKAKLKFEDEKLPAILSKYNVKLIGSYSSIKDINKFKCMKCLAEFEDNFCNGIICRKCNPIDRTTSLQEQEILTYIRTIYKGKIIANDRHLGFELDIFLPEINVAIEYNGNYWHSIEFKDELYHVNKTNTCENKNIRLLMIFESEYLNDKNSMRALITSFINNKIVYAGNRLDRRFYSSLNCNFEYQITQPEFDSTLNTFNSGFINKIKHME